MKNNYFHSTKHFKSWQKLEINCKIIHILVTKQNISLIENKKNIEIS